MDAVSKNDNSKFMNVLNRIWNGPSDETENHSFTMQRNGDAVAKSEYVNNVSDFKIEVKTDEPVTDVKAGEQAKPDLYPLRPGFQPQSPYEFSAEKDHGSTKQVTVISKGTTITGDVKSDGDFEIYGAVKGSVSTTGNVKISGKQTGDVTGANITLVSSTIRGNLTATEDISVDSDSVIIGDIKTKNLIINGKLQGNVHAKNSINCQGNAIVIGDLIGATVTVNDGAKLQGKMQIFNGQMSEIKIQDESRNAPPAE